MVSMKEYQRIYKSARAFIEASHYLFSKGYSTEYYKSLTPDRVEKLARRIRKLDARVKAGDDWTVTKINHRKPSQYHGGNGSISHSDIIRIAELENIQDGIIEIYIKPTAELIRISVNSDSIELLERKKVSI